MSSFLQNTQKLIHEAAAVAQVPNGVLESLQKPNKILEFEIPLKKDSGAEQKFQGWRVQHNNVLGPYKGGIRYHSDSSLEEVEALASLMTWKTSLMGIPYGGGKGAVKVNPRNLSVRELEELSRGYVRAVWANIGPKVDVPAPDVNTNAHIMDWMTDEYSKLIGHWEPAAFTGKSVEKGGSKGREIATGFGGFVVLREYLKAHDITNSTVAIQGFGNVGSNIGKILFNHGFKIIAISDSKGALYEKDGIDIHKVLDVKEKTGIIERTQCYAVSEEKRGQNMLCKEFSNKELLEMEVDVLIPSALENQITEENAPRIKAKVILEMANGPTTIEADKILHERGIDVIPDILANGGGVVGSYFEWVQSLEQKYWSEEEVLQKIDEAMVSAFAAVLEAKRFYNTTWRLASYIRAILRVVQNMKSR